MLEKSIRTEIMIEELKSRGFAVVKKGSMSGISELLTAFAEYDGGFSVGTFGYIYKPDRVGVDIVKNKATCDEQILDLCGIVEILEVLCDYSFTKIEYSDCGRYITIKCRNNLECF